MSQTVIEVTNDEYHYVYHRCDCVDTHQRDDGETTASWPRGFIQLAVKTDGETRCPYCGRVVK